MFLQAACGLQWRDTERGNILKYHIFLWAAPALQWRDTKSVNILKYYILFWAAQVLQWRDTRVLGSKLVFRGLCKASKASNWSKPKKGSLKNWNRELLKKKNLKNCSGRQMPHRGIGASNAIRGYWGVKCHPRVLGRQMPPRGIGASNATRGYRGVKCHPGVLGRQMPHWDYRGVKGHTGVKRPASGFMRSQRLGRQRSGASGIRWGGQGSKFGRQGSGRQRSRASKEMNPLKVPYFFKK